MTNIIDKIKEMFGSDSTEYNMPSEGFFKWLITERVGSRGPEFSLMMRAACKQANVAAQHAREQGRPDYAQWAKEYADAMEKVSRFNAAHTLAVIEELEGMAGLEPEERRVEAKA